MKLPADVLAAKDRVGKADAALRADIESTSPVDKIRRVESWKRDCQKHFGTMEQVKRHITDDVLPPLPRISYLPKRSESPGQTVG